ncbi:MAG: hypothetical protein JWR61_1407 [Ferruginibacter sp.]|nr:hypothetical protein [Ferruginibacter sp.]
MPEMCRGLPRTSSWYGYIKLVMKVCAVNPKQHILIYGLTWFIQFLPFELLITGLMVSLVHVLKKLV